MKQISPMHIIIAILIAILASHYLLKALAFDLSDQPVLSEIVHIGTYTVFFFAAIFGQLWLKKRQKK
ncbi:hypothetical protein EHM69_05115 [candidate division KSB1 bacterium]|nr:MAG: hypothetical protein EHM69_05115 [candidate division KSB1 bacterium]